MDPYRVLGVDPSADDDTIRRAFRKAALSWHPDRNPAPEASARFQEAVAAYEQLRGRRPTPGPRTENPGPRRRRRGEDIDAFVGVDLATARSGGSVTLTYERLGPCGGCGGGGSGPGARCPGCAGSGLQTLLQWGLESTIRCEVCGGDGALPSAPCERCEDQGTLEEVVARRLPVEPGARDGDHLRLRGEGHRGLEGGRDGDLRVVFRVGRQDLLVDAHASRGSTVLVHAETGSYRVKVPLAVRTGTRLRLPERGWNGGDLHVRVTLDKA